MAVSQFLRAEFLPREFLAEFLPREFLPSAEKSSQFIQTGVPEAKPTDGKTSVHYLQHQVLLVPSLSSGHKTSSLDQSKPSVSAILRNSQGEKFEFAPLLADT